MTQHYTTEDQYAGYEAIRARGLSTARHPAEVVTAILDAVAPAIAARALRDAAQATSIRSDMWGRHGADFLNARADEIEGSA